MEKLEDDFVPGAFDVMCARGKEAYTHRGNKSFRATLEHHLPSYADANTKQKKSVIVSSIFNAIQEATPDGGFIRKNKNGHWCRVPINIAREKVGQGFRDLLFTEYRSSTKAKIMRRRERLYSSTSSDNKTQDQKPKESGKATTVEPASKVQRKLSFDTEPLPFIESNGRPGLTILHQCSFSFVRDHKSEVAEPSLSSEKGFTGEHPGGQPNYQDENQSASGPAHWANEPPRVPYYRHGIYDSWDYNNRAAEPVRPTLHSPQAPHHYYHSRQDAGGGNYYQSRAWSWSGTAAGYHCGNYPGYAHSWGECDQSR